MKKHSSAKAYSWWWDSHISPKNIKWLSENLQEMEKLVKEMLKLIEEEGDSFASKADMYYQRRPELASHVENFHRMYRTLAERYDQVTGELRRSISNNSRSGDSDSGSNSPLQSSESSPREKQLLGLRSSPRAAGFDFFLGSGVNSDASRKGSDVSSLSSGSDSEIDSAKEDGELDRHEHCGASVHDGRGVQELRVLELEKELSGAMERLGASELEIQRLYRELGSKSLDSEIKISELERELSLSNQRLLAFEDEIASLAIELERNSTFSREREEQLRDRTQTLVVQNEQLQHKIEELNSEVSSKDSSIAMLDAKLSEIGECHLQDRCRLEQLNVTIGDLAESNSALEAAITEHESKIAELQSSLSCSTEKFSEAETRLKHEIAALESQLVATKKQVEELNKCMDKLKLEKDMVSCRRDELDAIVQSQCVRIAVMEGEIQRLAEERRSVTELEEEMAGLRVVVSEGEESKREAIRQLCSSLDYYRAGYVELRQVLLDHREQHQGFLASLIACA